MTALVIVKGMNAGKPHHFDCLCDKGLQYWFIWRDVDVENANTFEYEQLLSQNQQYSPSVLHTICIRIVCVIQCVNNTLLGSCFYFWDFLGIRLLNQSMFGCGRNPVCWCKTSASFQRHEEERCGLEMCEVFVGVRTGVSS